MGDRDYAEKLRQARKKPHAVFHKFLLLLDQERAERFFVFFEGNDDGVFYMPFIRESIHSPVLIPMVCEGRTEVLKVRTLIDSDGRGADCSLFFIDKDLSNFLEKQDIEDIRIFETVYYSIENYLVCAEVITGFWTDVLHLDWGDDRRAKALISFRTTYDVFCRRMALLMSLVLVGRGAISEFPPRKLNLNNANLDSIFDLDFDAGRCNFKKNAGIRFCISTNILQKGESSVWRPMRAVYRKHIEGEEPKKYLRGKYDLWFFVKFLQHLTGKLSEKGGNGEEKRATPNVAINLSNAVSVLSAKMRCPTELREFLGKYKVAAPPSWSVSGGNLSSVGRCS